MKDLTNAELAEYIDLTLVKPDATPAQIMALCAEAKRYGFRAACVNPVHLALAVERLRGSRVLPITVVGFPLGANLPVIKTTEAAYAVASGAKEVDMVANISALKCGEDKTFFDDIEAVVKVCGGRWGGIPVKVILETALLTEREIVNGCTLALHAGATYVKTSTGQNPAGGATVEAVRLMAETVGAHMGIKASGGIKDRATALAMIEAGATRIGASSGRAIMEG